jgi:hypothetical protein
MFRKKLRADCSKALLAIIRCRILCLPIGYAKTQRLRYTELPFCLLFCMDVKLGRSHKLRVFENRVLRRIFGSRRDKVTGVWRKIHNEELHDLYSFLNIVPLNRSRRIRWAGHVARMGRREAYTGLWLGNLRERDHLKDPGVDGRIILRWFFRKWDEGVWTRSSCHRIGRVGRHL